MEIRLTAHIKQHAGDILLECQDSFNYNLDNRAFAVSDGVSQAYCPELWSRLLTSAYVRHPEIFFTRSQDGLRLNTDLDLKDNWEAMEADICARADSQEKFILSLKKESVGVGAATFIGVHLKEEGIVYQTVGDSVLFFYDTREERLDIISSMVSDGEMAFTNSPEYIDTEERIRGKVAEGILPFKDGILFMATDALSDWILADKETTLEKIERLINVGDHIAYSNCIDALRTDKEDKMKDDDATFIALEFSGTEDTEPHFIINYAPLFDQLTQEDLLLQYKIASTSMEGMKQAKSKTEFELTKTKRDLAAKENRIGELEAEVGILTDEIEQLNKTVNALRSQSEKDKPEVKNDVQQVRQPSKADERFEQLRSQVGQLISVCASNGGLQLEDMLDLAKALGFDDPPSRLSFIEITTFKGNGDGGIIV